MEPSHYRYMEGNSLAPCCCLAFQHSSSWTDFCRLSQRSLTSPARQWEGASCAQKAPKVQMCPGSTVSLLCLQLRTGSGAGASLPIIFSSALLCCSHPCIPPTFSGVISTWFALPHSVLKKKKKNPACSFAFFTKRIYAIFKGDILYGC